MKTVIDFKVSIEYETDGELSPGELGDRLYEALEHERQEGSLTLGTDDLSANWVRLDCVAGSARVETVPKTEWLLSVYMCTDDDAQICYMGDTYCLYEADLDITKSFPSRSEAVAYFVKHVKVIYGSKASQFTHEWLLDTALKLARGADAESVGGNQTYDASVVEVEGKR